MALCNNEVIHGFTTKFGVSLAGTRQFLSGQPVQDPVDRMKLAQIVVANLKNLEPVRFIAFGAETTT